MKYKSAIFLFLALCAIMFAYSSSLHGDFQFDDDDILEMNLVRNPEQFLRINWLQQGLQGARPVAVLTFALNYALGGRDPSGYHVFNLFIHLLVVVAVYFFTRKTLSYAGYRNAGALAAIIAALFGLHPVQSQAVSYIAQREESMAALFYLLSLLMLIHAREKGFSTGGIALYGSGMLTFVAGLGTKEIVITLPAAYLLYDLFFLEKRPFSRRLFLISPFLAGGVAVILLRLPMLVSGTSIGFNLSKVTLAEYLMTQCRVAMTYLRLLFLPVNQSMDYDYPLIRNASDPGLLLSLVVIGLLLSVAYLLRKRYRVVSFGILWFFLVLMPTSSFVPIVDVIFEHRLYLASWGIITAGVCICAALFERLAASVGDLRILRRLSAAALAAVLLLSGWALYERNRVWQTKLSLWTDVASKSPGKARAHNNLGNCYFIADDFERAIPEYEKAIAIDKRWFEAYYNLAMSLEKTGRAPESVYYYLFFAREAPDAYRHLKKRIFLKFGMSG